MSGPLLTGPSNGASLADGTEARRCADWLPPETGAWPRASRVAPTVQTTQYSLIILGTDAVLAARPATPVQLAHACRSAGYHAAIPSSWGDELVAARAVDKLRSSETPLVQCSCPKVSERLAAHGGALGPMLLAMTAPPAATAEYLRAIYAPARPRITFAGACPAGSHPSIDVWLTPDELLSAFAGRGIVTRDQPTEFDSIIPPDRRRYFSEPGGFPSRQALRHPPVAADLVELKGDDVVAELAQQLLSRTPALIDASLAAGCCCSGVVGSVNVDAARPRVRELEPPRALAPVVDHSIPLPIEVPFQASTPAAPANVEDSGAPSAATVRGASIDNSSRVPPAPVAADDTSHATPQPVALAAEPAPGMTAKRRSPAGSSRPVLGSIPVARADAGRRLPRAFVARRRSSPRGVRQSSIESVGLPSESVGTSAPLARRSYVGPVLGLAAGLLLASILFLLL